MTFPGHSRPWSERYQDRLVGILYHLVGSLEEAEDLSQDVLLRVFKARKGYRPRAKFSTWLFTIANNLALNHLRSKGRNHSVPMSGAGNDSNAVAPIAQRIPSRETTASSQMRKIELSEIVREALDVLGADQRMAVLLNKFEDMSYAEIGEVMNRSPGGHQVASGSCVATSFANGLSLTWQTANEVRRTPRVEQGPSPRRPAL